MADFRKWFIAFMAGALLLGLTAHAAEKPVKQSWLDARAKYWAGVLRLNDWEIQVQTARIEEIPPDTAGASVIVKRSHSFLILVLDPQDYGKLAVELGAPQLRGRAIRRDIEDTIIHEQIHLRLSEFAAASDEDLRSAEEMTVVRLTSALLAARHKKVFP
jgi:hypothetical protein